MQLGLSNMRISYPTSCYHIDIFISVTSDVRHLAACSHSFLTVFINFFE